MKYVVGLPIFLSMVFIDYATTIVHAVEYRYGSSEYRASRPNPVAHHGYLRLSVLWESLVRGFRGQYHS